MNKSRLHICSPRDTRYWAEYDAGLSGSLESLSGNCIAIGFDLTHVQEAPGITSNALLKISERGIEVLTWSLVRFSL